jgi:hypothetical protein
MVTIECNIIVYLEWLANILLFHCKIMLDNNLNLLNIFIKNNIQKHEKRSKEKTKKQSFEHDDFC